MSDYDPIQKELLDMEGIPWISNETLSTMLGYSKIELSQMKFTDFTYAEDIDKDIVNSIFTNFCIGK